MKDREKEGERTEAVREKREEVSRNTERRETGRKR